MIHENSALLTLLLLAVTVFVLFYVFRWIRRSFGKLGLSQGEIALIIWGTIIGSFINIPLIPYGDAFLGVNVGGAVIPTLLSLYLISTKKLPYNEVLVGVILVAIVTHLVTEWRPGMGVVAEFPYWLLPALMAFVISAFAYWHERDHSAALAYVVGTLGVLIGADLVRIPLILSTPPPAGGGMLSIGGAAVFDMVYLTGILAVSMETGLLVKRRQDWSRAGRSNPIDAEYEAWKKRIEERWETGQEERRRRDAMRRREPSPTSPPHPAQQAPQDRRPPQAPRSGTFQPVGRPDTRRG